MMGFFEMHIETSGERIKKELLKGYSNSYQSKLLQQIETPTV
jgi:hypothetical protein